MLDEYTCCAQDENIGEHGMNFEDLIICLSDAPDGVAYALSRDCEVAISTQAHAPQLTETAAVLRLAYKKALAAPHIPRHRQP